MSTPSESSKFLVSIEITVVNETNTTMEHHQMRSEEAHPSRLNTFKKALKLRKTSKIKKKLRRRKTKVPKKVVYIDFDFDEEPDIELGTSLIA